ncbi:MAG: sensor histidine kinase [Chloroflexota bacterium]
MLRGPWQHWSLQARLLLSILLVLAATITASGLLFYLSSAATIERQTLALTGNTVSQMSRSVDLYVENVGRLSRSISGDTIVQRVLRLSDPASGDRRQPDDEADVSYRLLVFAASWPSVRGLYLYANDGTLFYFTRGELPRRGVTADDEPWSARMRQQAAPPALLWPTAPESTVAGEGRPVFSYVRLLKNTATGRRIGFLKIDLDVAVMSELLALSETAGQGRQVLLLDDEGHVIYDSTAALTGRLLDDLRLAGASYAQGKLQWRGGDYYYAAQRSERTGWTTWMLTPVDLISAETRRAGVVVLLLCAGAMLVLSAIVYVVTKRITQPLRLMAQTMARVENGDLSVRVPHTTATHELGRLSRVFNTMLNSIERLITQVYEARLREKDAQLLALQSQINPHFLFNTLNSMRALSRKGQADTVATMAESLADLFRYSMSNWNELVPLREELLHIENYVMIQRARFGERIRYVCAVPEELQHVPLVKLSLQPLVENAITHGREHCSDVLEIRVHARREGDELAIDVTDNAGAFSPVTLARIKAALGQLDTDGKLPTADVGIGITNIDRRIKLLFGEQYGLRFKVIPDVSTTVTLHIPLHTRDRDRAEEVHAYEHPHR